MCVCYPTASRLRFEPGPSAPESSMLTTRIPSQVVQCSRCVLCRRCLRHRHGSRRTDVARPLPLPGSDTKRSTAAASRCRRPSAASPTDCSRRPGRRGGPQPAASVCPRRDWDRAFPSRLSDLRLVTFQLEQSRVALTSSIHPQISLYRCCKNSG